MVDVTQRQPNTKGNQMKTAYLIRSGELTNSFNISNKLHSYKASRKALRAAKRMGFKNAYAGKMMVSDDARLK